MTIHGAQYSKEIIAEIRDILFARWPTIWARPMLFDPFAGTGKRLAQIAAGDGPALGFDYGGIEIEASFIDDRRIQHGTATDPDLYPERAHVIVTSPVYPNGMADSWKMSDGSKRHTYRSWVAQNEGKDRELDDENMGRYGYRGTKRDGRSTKRAAYWDLAERAVKCWSGAVFIVLNVSDFLSGDQNEPVTADWVKLLMRHGWMVSESRRVETQRNGEGANRDLRPDFESVLLLDRNY